jgi:hypothetical protein
MAVFSTACNTERKMENRIVTAETIDVVEHELKNADRNALLLLDCKEVIY